MKRKILIKIIIWSLFVFALLSYGKTQLPNLNFENESFINWLIDFLIFSISFVLPLIIGNRLSDIDKMKDLVAEFEENLNIEKAETIQFLYNKIQRQSNKFTLYPKSLNKDYLFVRLYKPVIDFFYSHKENEFYDKPNNVKDLFNDIISIIEEIELNKKEQNMDVSSIYSFNDKMEIIETLLSACIFYEFYHPLNLKEDLTKLFEKHKSSLKIEGETSTLNHSILMNDFKFDLGLLDNKYITGNLLKDLNVFFDIQNDSVKLANLVNSPEQKYDKGDVFVLYLNFFENKRKIQKENTILNLIFNIELIAFYDYLRNTFSKIEISKSDLEIIKHKSDISLEKQLPTLKTLEELIQKYFYLKYKIDLKSYLNAIFTEEINSQSYGESYHPIFDLYYSLNSSTTTDINYYPSSKGISNLDLLHLRYHKDIHIWFIDRINKLIRNDEIDIAQKIYNELDFDKIHESIEVGSIYKYSMLLCKSVFENRLNNNYEESIKLLLYVLDNTTLNSDIRDAKYLIFTFSFEKRDKKAYRDIYDNSDKQIKSELLDIANIIRLFENVDYLHIGNWIYVSYPVINGFSVKDNRMPNKITGVNKV